MHGLPSFTCFWHNWDKFLLPHYIYMFGCYKVLCYNTSVISQNTFWWKKKNRQMVLTFICFSTHISLFTIFLEDSSILFPIFFFWPRRNGPKAKQELRKIKRRNVYTIVEWMFIKNKQTPTTTDISNGAPTLREDLFMPSNHRKNWETGEHINVGGIKQE